MISYAALREFIALWHEETGEDISDGQATEIAMELLCIFDHIYKPVKKGWLVENTNKNENGKRGLGE